MYDTKVLFSQALRALHERHPGHAYYDRHGKADRMSKMLLDRCHCIDHVRPVTDGGSIDIDNLVCA